MLSLALIAALLCPFPQESVPTDSVPAPAWVPFEFFSERYIYVDVVIEGVATQAVLDCGAGITVVSSAFADEIGLPQGRRMQARGVGGMQAARLVGGIELESCGLALHDLQVAVIDLDSVAERIGRPLPLILGREVFAQRVVELDYPGTRLRLHEPEGYRYQGPGNTLELVAIGTHWAVDGAIEGRPARFVLDTGSGATGTVFGDYADRHGLLLDRTPRSDLRAGGVGGALSVAMATLRELEFGGYRLDDVPMGFDGGGDAGAFSVLPGDCNLGNKLFRRFRIVFDAPGRKLHVEPGPAWDRPFKRERSGLQLTYRGDGLEVIHVASGSPAERAGYAVGERIVAVGGQAVDGTYWNGLYLWREADPGTEVRLTMGDGEERSLILATYY